jgi:hypothetical protein
MYVPLHRCNERANVLDAPHRAAAELDRLREAAGTDAVPPAGFLDGYDWWGGWDRFWVTDDLRQAQEASFWEEVHLQPSLYG